MSTNILMSVSSFFMFASGLAFTFFPQEFLETFKSPASPIILLILQLLGALYLGFGMVNWMTRSNLIGGIYSRPIAIGNFMHFLVGGLALLKGSSGVGTPHIWGLAAVYTGFAIAFGLVVFTNPSAVKTSVSNNHPQPLL